MRGWCATAACDLSICAESFDPSCQVVRGNDCFADAAGFLPNALARAAAGFLAALEDFAIDAGLGDEPIFLVIGVDTLQAEKCKQQVSFGVSDGFCGRADAHAAHRPRARRRRSLAGRAQTALLPAKESRPSRPHAAARAARPRAAPAAWETASTRRSRRA